MYLPEKACDDTSQPFNYPYHYRLAHPRTCTIPKHPSPNFHYYIYPPEKGSSDLDSWLSSIAKNNMNIAVQHFIKRSKQEGVPETDGETPFTTPGQGLKPAQIKGVVLHQEYGYGVGGMMLIKYNPYLLLRDGTIYSHPEVCAYNLDVARSREVEPGKWGPWKLEDTTFNTRGQFTTSSTGGGSFNGSGGSVTAYRSKDGAGTYTFDGFSLELKYDNGKIVRKNFCFYADSKDVWTFGTRPYTPSDSNKKK